MNYRRLLRELELDLLHEDELGREFEGELASMLDRESENPLPTPVISLKSVTVSGRPAAFSKAGSGFQALVCDPFPYPQCYLNIYGNILVEESGARRPFTAADRTVWQPVSAFNQVYTRRGVSVSTSLNLEAHVAADGSFTTESQLAVDPGTARIRVLINLDFRSGKRITTEAIIQYSPLECFLTFIGDWETRQEPWRTSPPCRDAVTRLEFLSATRKMFQPTTNKDGAPPSPGWKKIFDKFLARNKEICPLAEFNSPQARAIWRFERLEIAGSMVNIGHVLTGIEGGRKQQPNSTYWYLLSRDATTEATLTWGGDLGKALEQYAESIVTGQRPDLRSELGKAAGPANLLGDIDGINLAVTYDEDKSLADNLRRYYYANPFRRFRDFLTSAKDDSGMPLFALVSNSPPTIDRSSRQRPGVRISFFAAALMKYKLESGLLNLTASQQYDLASMLTPVSKETKAVLDYFFSFLEKGLGNEQ